MRLTDISIKALKAPEKGATVHPDDALSGFGVRISEGGTKSFVLTYGKLRRRETIGRVGVISLSDARAEAKRRLAQYVLGKNNVASPAWNAALELFHDDTEARLKARTCADYDRLLRLHFRFGDMKLSEIGPADIQTRIDRLRATPAEQHHAFVVLRTFMRWAHRRHYLDVNPMDRMASGYRYRPRSRVLNDQELKQVWHTVERDRFGIVVKLLILTGQRIGEITKLSRDMIGENSITLPGWLTKNAREHTFPIGPMTWSLLQAQPLPKTSRYSPVPCTGFVRHKARLDKISGVTGWTLHDLRRTFASGLAARGVSLPVIERLLNHRSGSFGGIVGVYQLYDFMPEMRAAVSLWERHLQKLTGSDTLPPLMGVNPRGMPGRKKAVTQQEMHVKKTCPKLGDGAPTPR